MPDHVSDASSKPTRSVVVSPGVDMTLEQLVAVSRASDGEFACVALGGGWKEAGRANLAHLEAALAAASGKSISQLADFVRRTFSSRTHPAAIKDLISAPADPATDRRLAARAVIYGVTTGFGVNKDQIIEREHLIHEMQVNLLRSHASGMGAPLPVEVVRAMMLLRLRTFVEGCSCVRPETTELLRDVLNAQVHPWVPEQGSVGSSGDLCPLSHLSLILIGEGLAWRGSASGAPRAAGDVLREAGLHERATTSLAPKEGLALINGTAMSTALASLAVHDAGMLLGAANLAASMSLQALHGCSRAFDPKIHRIRRHEGQAAAAADIIALARGSTLLDRADDVQDVYSLRCAPAVHGAAAAAVAHVREIVELEINAVTDNPLFFAADGDAEPIDGYASCVWKAYSGGNFHGEPVGMAADYLKMAVAELGGISERRTQCLLDRHFSRGLPANLWPAGGDSAGAGLNSGLMIAQYAAASLVSENKVLAHPASVDSIPTSSNAEDHNAMSSIAARHLRRVVDNVRHVIAIEVLAAAQALEIRMRSAPPTDAALSRPARAVLEALRAGDGGHPGVPFVDGRDRALWPLIATTNARLPDLLRAARSALD